MKPQQARPADPESNAVIESVTISATISAYTPLNIAGDIAGDIGGYIGVNSVTSTSWDRAARQHFPNHP
jgi:hypothetical protein